MPQSLAPTLRYWRNSLVDSLLGTGILNVRAFKNYIEVSNNAWDTGLLTPEDTLLLFKDMPQDASITVAFLPIIMAKKKQRGVSSHNGLPERVAPIVIEATINRQGIIQPIKSVVPRDILSPVSLNSFSIGDVDDLDTYLTHSPQIDMSQDASWEKYKSYISNMLKDVTQDWHINNPEYHVTNFCCFKRINDNQGYAKNNIILYDKIISQNPDLPLLNQIIHPQTSCPRDGNIEGLFSRRLGHSNPHFPLSEKQRQVIAHLDAAPEGTVIAVNGPPGTGKTTMLLSAIANFWIKAAYEKGEPPIIIAASTNNQAVTNIIDAFGKDFAQGEGPFSGRWLPDIHSFGIYLAAKSKAKDVASKYQTESFQEEIETKDYFNRSKPAYIKAGQAAFPNRKINDIKTIVSLIHEEIVQHVKFIEVLDEKKLEIQITENKIQEKLKKSPDIIINDLKEITKTKEKSEKEILNLKKLIQEFLANESILLDIFNFIPAVKAKRALRALNIIQNIKPDFPNMGDINDIRSELDKLYTKEKNDLQKSQDDLSAAQEYIDAFKAAKSAYEKHYTHKLGFIGENDLDDTLDCQIRFKLFQLATHYWEGRWLMTMEADLADICASHKKTGKKSTDPRWQRRMMITPCAVATLASLPGKMSYATARSDDSIEYLYNFADLLIIDEAGQVLPENAGASFSLAKRALVIGDTQQLEPISNIPQAVDIGNLKACGLMAHDSDYTAIERRGINSCSGSAMRLAQEATHISPYQDMEKGLYLLEHRRCYDEIINYSNTLCYKGKIQPMRGAAPKDKMLPALGHMHIVGFTEKRGTSSMNLVEAKTIARWLSEKRTELEAHYQDRLENIVGVVTPFSPQVNEIRTACQAQGITVEGPSGMTIGTVHSLQGAERKVIIFSAVYSGQNDRDFIDRYPSMLNVSVSRAKDSFLVFGDMNLISRAVPGTPRAILGEFLFAHEDNALEYIAEARADLVTGSESAQLLRDAKQHDTFLLQVLKEDRKRYVIVSPWVVIHNIQRAGVLSAMEAAVQRGATIDVYLDPLLKEASSITATKELFRKLGISTHEVKKIHSKIVIVDDNLLAIGSFNWLSAQRSGVYVRHETSLAYRGPQVKKEIETILSGLPATSQNRNEVARGHTLQ